MGAVKMDENHIRPADHFMVVTYCLYCDKCGSFKIGRRVTAINLIWFLAAAIISILILYGLGGLGGGSPDFLAGLPCVVFLLIFVIQPTGIFDLGYRCKKCGNKHITGDNVLNYPASDRTILDVPFESTKTFYRDEY